ncbi:hypothetical protein Tco_1040907 [Tanacetum coccineum]|uniref:Synaptobrevin, longin-like domain protein n=1 Tax=Tanacetum coccineum TaxID=301880 RepID=A0ABQ5GH26_9ASTR
MVKIHTDKNVADLLTKAFDLQALVDGKKIIVTEASIRSDLQLNDEEGMDCLPKATIFKELTRMGYEKLSQKLTFYKAFFSPQWKFLIHTILQCLNEAVYEERDDSLERAATTTTGLDAEHDRGNINKTQSKATPNEPSSPGTSSGGGPRRQETMGDTIAQTRSENVSKFSNDPLLSRAQEITSIKLRVKKLEKKGGSRTYKLKRLYKVGKSARVISSDEAILGDQEDASKQGRKINNIDKDAEITLVHETQGRYGDEEIFDTCILDGDDVLAEPEVTEKANAVEEPSESITTTPTLTTITAATTIKAVSTRPRAKGLVIHEEKQETTPILRREEKRLARYIKLKEKKEGNCLWDKDCKQVDADYQMAQQMQVEEQEELSIEEKSKLFV